MPEFLPSPIPLSYLSTDGTLAANSDVKVPTEKAIKTYADQIIAAADAMVFKGVIDCSANPNYPAADRGHTYRVSVAGKIGGGSGVNVEAGDLLLCLTDGTSSGDQATVGTSWSVAQANIDGAVTGPASGTNGALVRQSGTTGKVLVDANGSPVSLTTEVTGTLPIANGGTGETSAAAAILALLPSQSGNSGKALVSNGTAAAWGLPSHPLSEVWVTTPNGFGSTNTRIRIYTVVQSNVGTAITYATSAANGASFTINETGYYTITRADSRSGGTTNFTVTKNAASLTTSPIASEVLPMYSNATTTGTLGISCCVYLTAGDVLRPHDGATLSDGTIFINSFHIIYHGR